MAWREHHGGVGGLRCDGSGEPHWGDAGDLPDRQVHARLFQGSGEHDSAFAPEWERVHREMARVGVTLKLLHGRHVDGRATGGDGLRPVLLGSQ